MKNKKLTGYDDYIRYLYEIQKERDRQEEIDRKKEEEERNESKSN